MKESTSLQALCVELFPAWIEARLPRSGRARLAPETLLRRTLQAELSGPGQRGEAELLDHVRRELLLRMRLETRGPAAAGDSSTAEASIGAETLQRYDAAMARLEPEQRQAIVMRIEMGCSYDRIAAWLGKSSTGAARMAICRALVHLALEIAREG